MIERDVFIAALQKEDADQRREYLRAACGPNPALLERVEGLLKVYEDADSFLESPAPAPTLTVESPGPLEGPGTVIGPYKLLEQIGEGGMGVVYFAEQTQPVRRKVALKVIKPGMDTRQVIARFEAERQALAMMDHPNIAKVHDAGATESGRPYFVMELVRGIPITEYCDRERLSIPERLELFVLVCRAVQHAHQKGIIHRDLKPSNILVTVIDGTAVPKVIDFGVAKATGASLTERTIHTGFHQFVGTPLYMSPEQADVSGMDMDTRSDIYSLGVLLYELLTGTTPFDQETFRTAAFDEMRRIIREEEPQKPSTRLSSLGAVRTTVSDNRKADVRHLDRTLRGELDWIVMKALEKDRRGRYETASDFAADVMRYLTDKPVEACPPSVWYRSRKYARRNRLALTTLAIVSLALIGGTGVSLWQAIRAEGLRIRAENRSQFARRVVDEMYTQVAEKWLAQQPKLTALQRDFLDKAAAFYQEFARDPGSDSAARHAAAEAADRLGQIQEKIGQHAEAEASYRVALTLEEEVSRHFPGDSEYQRGLARAHFRLGHLLAGPAHRLGESEHSLRQGLSIQERLVDGRPDEVDFRRDLARSYAYLGIVLDETFHPDDAERAYSKSVDLAESVVRGPGARADDRLQLSRTLSDVANRLSSINQMTQAIAASDRSIELLRQIVAESPDQPDYRYSLALACMNRGSLEEGRKQFPELERFTGEATALFDRLVTEFPLVPEYRERAAVCYRNQEVCLWQSGRRQEGEPYLHRALQLEEALVAEHPEIRLYRQQLLGGLQHLGVRLLHSGRHEEVERIIRRSAKLCAGLDADSRVQGPDHERQNLVHLADSITLSPPSQVKFSPGIYGLAQEIARKALEVRPEDQMGLQSLAWAQYRVGDWKGCIESFGKLPHFAREDFFVAMAYWQLGDKTQARAEFDRADKWLKRYTERVRERQKQGFGTHPDPRMLREVRAEAASLLGLNEPTTNRGEAHRAETEPK